MLLRILSGMPGLRPVSIASLIRCAVPFTASDTSAIVDFDSRVGDVAFDEALQVAGAIRCPAASAR